MTLFVVEYILYSGKWVVSTGSPHVYNSSNLGCGTVTDRDGVILMDIGDGRTYSDNAETPGFHNALAG